MKKASKLRKVRESRGFQGYEIAEKLGMWVVRYMVIELHCWEEPTEEEVLKICAFFRMDAQALGFGAQFWSLSIYSVRSESHTSGKGHDETAKPVVKMVKRSRKCSQT